MLWAARVETLVFQAKDGIRALYMTGVQTCALPISKITGSCIIKNCPHEIETSSEFRYKQEQDTLHHGCLRASRQQRGHGRRRQIGRASCRERGQIAVCVAFVYRAISGYHDQRLNALGSAG